VRIYLPGDVPDAGHYPSILAIGDSWFWYPGNNLLMAVAQHPKVKDPYRNIQIIGYDGAPIAQYVVRNGVKGMYAPEIARQLAPLNAQYYSAVMISGGGNDAVDYGLALNRQCNGITDAGQCLSTAGLQTLLDGIREGVAVLLAQVAAAFAGRPVHVFLNGYDYPVPDGRPFRLAGLKVLGPWLKPALDNAGVEPDDSLRLAVCKDLIDALNEVFASFNDPAKRIYYVNSRGVLDRSPANYRKDWDNEMHPTISGFAKVVDQRWIPMLQNLGYANA
jgi:hypothetical protein